MIGGQAGSAYDPHREEREKLERRIAELERQLLEYARKIAERKSGS